MDRSTLAILTLIAAVAMFIASKLAQRTGLQNTRLHVLTRVLRITVLGLAAVYFYIRFTA